MIPGPGKTTSVAPLPQSLIRWRNACKVSFRVKVKVKGGTQYQDEIVHNCKHRWRKACKVKFIQGIIRTQYQDEIATVSDQVEERLGNVPLGSGKRENH